MAWCRGLDSWLRSYIGLRISGDLGLMHNPTEEKQIAAEQVGGHVTCKLHWAGIWIN